ncbi:hypothetical protein SAMN05216351_11168 [Pseudobutyrivibrio sp. JW11]|uniref:hypothetical protein n=1 Tax=Pseudobutyrivibrio sp. JW11 TaxID=1855302 RepID=UPI0008E8EDF9|nr:hypothetical protein [Pseudobutyrivibrio sp. JW11]SFO47627.1 hypothetical protein SAMN05216351_11168 [Pseudobutyrivibrio sp. JW11]
MAEYLAESNYLFQSSISSSYLYFSNFANKDTSFGNALKTTSDEQLNTQELTDGRKNKGNSYTRIVSATVMNSELRTTTGEILGSKDILVMLMESYKKIHEKDDEDGDWRKMTDEEWEKLLARVDADIDDMVERVKEETEAAKEERAKAELEKEAELL